MVRIDRSVVFRASRWVVNTWCCVDQLQGAVNVLRDSIQRTYPMVHTHDRTFDDEQAGRELSSSLCNPAAWAVRDWLKEKGVLFEEEFDSWPRTKRSNAC